MVDEQGRRLPRSLVHHAQLWRKEKQGPAAILMGVAAEFATAKFPPGYGIPVRAGESLEWECMFANPFLRDYRQAYLDIEGHLRLRRGDVPDLKSVHLIRLTVDTPPDYTGPGEIYGYMVPPGVNERSRIVHFPFSGVVVMMGAHLHPYAEWLRLERTDTGEVVWRGLATPDADGDWLRSPQWSSAAGWHVSASEPFRLVARYNNTTSQPIAAMGIFGAYIHPDDAAATPWEIGQAN